MDTYSAMRHFADSWALLALTVFFVGVVVWVFRPGSTPQHRDSANIPFRHDDKPARTETTHDGATSNKEARK
ncbi:cytochrome c oxidase cbb3-type subunit 4 [Rhodovulum iodosum]|uniref:Cytochrome c oxidase cbb3-type subunit 4 n=1 Tax=Rhodovulum iodosum TaxID=68291 RepID=A0ABV3XQW9_9RHOB|nr:cbb3-type cytochrome c oxidase subunit 3 [Rhodovulum robiginosum]RSK32853.1 cbb3-type cytochrome c oxidase subunit 3 [Rhodovulum robiginosum]